MANEREDLERAIQALEAQRGVLDDRTIDAAVAGLRKRLEDLPLGAASGARETSLQHGAREASLGQHGARETSPGLPPPQQGAGPDSRSILTDERKLVTVVFADISGFTALSERMDPEEVRTLVNSCFDALVPAIDRYGGSVDKFIGDEVMALFGAPVAHEDHAERALRAALEMVSASRRFNERHRTALDVHIGINTGQVLAGGLGSSGRRQYSVVGDVVNLAARLKEAAPAGAIFVGPSTHRLCSPLFEFETLPPLQAKGRSQPTPCVRLVGQRQMPAPSRGIEGLSSPLVGRDAEMEALSAAAARLTSGQGSVVSIQGDPGLGKSRLVLELRRRTDDRTRWAEGRALSHTEGMSYWIVRDLLFNLLGLDPQMDPGDLAGALRNRLREVLGDPDAGAFRSFAYLARLVGAHLDPQEAEALDRLKPEALQRRMRGAVEDLVRGLCRRGPMILVWEDLHCADPSSLGLLETILPLAAREPLMVLLVFRAGESRIATWHDRVAGGAPWTQQAIRLEPLGPDESSRLAENLLRVEGLTAGASRAILGKAEGNPFFLEELLRSLMDLGLVLLDGDRAVAAAAVESLDVPDTLNGVIAGRIDRLPADAKRVLQTASILGRQFEVSRLASLLARDGASPDLDAALVELQRRELVRHGPRAGYVFKHALTHEVAYGGLLLSRRKVLHEMTAALLEASLGASTDDHAAELGYHYQRADRHDEAASYLAIAADRARKLFSNAEAIAFYRESLEQARRQQEKDEGAGQDGSRGLFMARLQESLGDVCALIGQREDARAAYEGSAATLSADDRIGRSRLRRKEGTTWVAERRPVEALEAFDRAEAVLGEAPRQDDPSWHHEWLEVQLDRCWGAYWLARVDEMESGNERTRTVVERHGTASQRARFFRNIVLTAYRRDRYVVSETVLDKARRGVRLREGGSRSERDRPQSVHARLLPSLARGARAGRHGPARVPRGLRADRGRRAHRPLSVLPDGRSSQAGLRRGRARVRRTGPRGVLGLQDARLRGAGSRQPVVARRAPRGRRRRAGARSGRHGDLEPAPLSFQGLRDVAADRRGALGGPRRGWHRPCPRSPGAGSDEAPGAARDHDGAGGAPLGIGRHPGR